MCDAKIRPFMGDTEIACHRGDEHTHHKGTLRDYAYPGSTTTVDWDEGDRRTFHGDWPGRCNARDWCRLPAGHRGDHIS